MIAKHELSLNQWVELFQFILVRCSSKDPGEREVRFGGRGCLCDGHVTCLAGWNGGAHFSYGNCSP